MANFNAHITTAAGISIGLSLGVYASGAISAQQSVILVLAGTLGGILPDIDSDSSISIDLIFKVLAGTLILVVSFTSVHIFGVLLTMLIDLIVYFGTTVILKKVFQYFTVHRGIFHSVPMGLLLSLLSIIIALLIEVHPRLAWGVGLCLFIGFISHLLLDEFCSVDLLGNRLKRSFGSAFKFFTLDQMPRYGIIYLGIIISLYYLITYMPDMMTDTRKVSLLWRDLLDNLWPNHQFCDNFCRITNCLDQ